MPRSFFENKELREKRINTIVNASLKLFAIYGSKKVTIDMITKECRYSHGLFYHYFSTKEDVLNEIKRRCHKIFTEKFIELSKTSAVGYDFLRSCLCVIVDLINDGGEGNYYVHLLFSTKLSYLNQGIKKLYLDKKVYNLYMDSIKEVSKDIEDMQRNQVLKKYTLLFLTLIDSLSLAKINYPDLYKKDIDGNALFDRLIGFAKVKITKS